MFYKAVKVDMANSKESSFNNTISSTLSLITVLFEDLLEAINIHKEFCGEKKGPKASITSLTKTNTCDGYDFNFDIINNDEYNALQKESLMLFEAYCTFDLNLLSGPWISFFCFTPSKTIVGQIKIIRSPLVA
jgi:hypothetical protein